ncbi:MAG: DNA double-strand break repair protein Mre11 [Metallosphaera sp.]
MQFLHISDTHLGSRRYNKESREKDVYDAFSQLMESAVREHVKGVIHTGDLFDVYKPGNRALKFFIDKVKLLRDKGIEFINIPGDHDTPKIKEELYPQRLLWESLGLIKVLMGDQDPKFYEMVEDGLSLRIYGVRHMNTSLKDKLIFTLNSLKPEGDRNVLMIHQGIRDILPYQGAWQLEIGSLPKDFQYYACGHIHTRVIQDLPGGGKLVISGSPEIIREDEIEGWKKYGKGGFLIDLSKKEPTVQSINVDVRPQEVITLNVNDIDNELVKLRQSYSGLKKEPIFHIVLEGDSIKRDYAMKKISKSLSGLVDFYRIYKDNTVSVGSNQVKVDERSTITDLIRSYLKSQSYSDSEVELILDAIDKYDSDEAESILRKFAEMGR